MEMNKNDLLNYYKEGISQPVLKDGEYTVTLKSHKFIENTQNPNNSYIRIEMVDKATGRNIVENKFNRGFQIMIAHLKKQLGKEDEQVKVNEFLAELVENQTEFKIWVEKYTNPDTQRSNTNIYFLEPIKTTPQVVEVVEDEVE